MTGLGTGLHLRAQDKRVLAIRIGGVVGVHSNNRLVHSVRNLIQQVLTQKLLPKFSDDGIRSGFLGVVGAGFDANHLERFLVNNAWRHIYPRKGYKRGQRYRHGYKQQSGVART